MKIHNAAPVATTNVNTNPVALKNKNTSFKGNFADKVTDFCKLSKQGTMARWFFVTNAFVFLLGSRILTSRDKDEKREILIRDIPTIVIAVMGVPVVGKLAAKLVQKKAGFAITKDKELVSYEQLQDWYKYDKNLSSGFEGFSQRLSNLGGNLKKTFSAIGGDTKEQLKGLSDNNDTFLKELTANKTLLKTVQDELAKDGNKVLKQAEFLTTTTKLAGFGTTLALIGILIPKLNIAITEAIHKKPKNETVPSEKA